MRRTFKRAELPLFYRKKESFGDADVILSMEGYKGNMREYIVETFQPSEIFHNGNCWSFDFKELQIDLITVAGEHFDSNFMYLGYNDLGNFIGRLAHCLGLKYGQEGLWYEHDFKGRNVGRIQVSKDYPKIFNFLGLSYERWLEGFDTLEDIFAYIAESKYFDYKSFQLEELNRINRERNLKRKSYMSFLEWIADNVSDDEHTYKFEDKKDYFFAINDFFPEAKLELNIRKLEYEVTKTLYIKSKLDVPRIIKAFDLKDKELGDAIRGFKESFGPVHNYESYMLNLTEDEIFERFRLYLKIHSNLKK